LTNVSYNGTEYSDSKGLEWNAQYQLTSVTSVSSVVNYSYDVLGRRTSRTEGTNVDQYVYSGNQVVADLDGSGNILRNYVWGPGVDNLLSMTVYTNGTTNTYFSLTDQQRTVHALVDGNGNVVESYEYDAWGRVLYIKNASGSSIANHQSEIGNRYLWQGREYDVVTGLYYFRARWYDPVVGRWLSKDPIGISGGLNFYAAFENNPVNTIDPSGLDNLYLGGGSLGQNSVLPGVDSRGNGIGGGQTGTMVNMNIIAVSVVTGGGLGAEAVGVSSLAYFEALGIPAASLQNIGPMQALAIRFGARANSEEL
jgi:RHS repeat-associated protein